VQKAGTWMSFGEDRLGQGRENARMFLKEHADVRARLEAKLLPALGLRVAEVESAAAVAEAVAEKPAPMASAGPGTRSGAAAPQSESARRR
jgi:recombination protein RecA